MNTQNNIVYRLIIDISEALKLVFLTVTTKSVSYNGFFSCNNQWRIVISIVLNKCSYFEDKFIV